MTEKVIVVSADEGDTGVAQVSKPAVSPISKSAGCGHGVASAGWETRATADLEVCATNPGGGHCVLHGIDR